MKTLCIFIAATFWLAIAYAQDKHDQTWLLGYPPVWPDKFYGGSLLEFDYTPLKVSYSNIGLVLGGAIGEICDKQGQLQFYTNGCEIYNARHESMENGDSLNFPYALSYESQKHNCLIDLFYPQSYNNLLPLPVPGREDEYVLFHLRYDRASFSDKWISAPQSLLYTRVDMAANGGAGRVTAKNRLMLRDTFCEHLAAVKHGNGRDWWVVAQKGLMDTAFLFLLTPEGIKAKAPQKIGIPWPNDAPYYKGWQSVFSQKGDLYARVNLQNGIHLYRFDRCEGAFFSPQIIPFPNDRISAPGLAFSPNGRWLYFGTGEKLFQYDCWATDIGASETLIGEYDGFQPHNGLWTTFHQMRLAPDNKIYMSAPNTVPYLHVIHNPDAQGAACHFEQHGIALPANNGFGLPNFPNFRLYGLEGSICDTLLSASGGPPQTESPPIKIFPNPANGRVTVVLPFGHEQGRLRVHNALGVLMLDIPLTAASSNGWPSFEVTQWPTGFYHVVYEVLGKPIKTARLVVQHVKN